MNSQTRKGYPTDLTDTQWNTLLPHIPQSKSNKKKGGRPETYPKREILNAIFYLKTTGCQWNLLPVDLPPWPIVYHYFHVWSINRTWKRINTKIRHILRRREGRNAHATVGIIDSQSAKSSSVTRDFGYDAGKKVVGRKRHILTDTLGLVIDAVVHSSAIQDRDGAKLVLKKAHESLTTIYGDGGYAGKLVAWVKKKYDIMLEIIKRNELHTFVVLPKRWVVERTLSWLSKARRLARCYEKYARTEESMIYVTMIHLMVRRVI